MTRLELNNFVAHAEKYMPTSNAVLALWRAMGEYVSEKEKLNVTPRTR